MFLCGYGSVYFKGRMDPAKNCSLYERSARGYQCSSRIFQRFALFPFSAVALVLSTIAWSLADVLLTLWPFPAHAMSGTALQRRAFTTATTDVTFRALSLSLSLALTAEDRESVCPVAQKDRNKRRYHCPWLLMPRGTHPSCCFGYEARFRGECIKSPRFRTSNSPYAAWFY